jgi:hypothetical protein
MQWSDLQESLQNAEEFLRNLNIVNEMIEAGTIRPE